MYTNYEEKIAALEKIKKESNQQRVSAITEKVANLGQSQVIYQPPQNVDSPTQAQNIVVDREMAPLAVTPAQIKV